MYSNHNKSNTYTNDYGNNSNNVNENENSHDSMISNNNDDLCVLLDHMCCIVSRRLSAPARARVLHELRCASKNRMHKLNDTDSSLVCLLRELVKYVKSQC